MNIWTGIGRAPVGFFLGLAGGIILRAAFTEGLVTAAIAAGIGALIWGASMLYDRIGDRLTALIFGSTPPPSTPGDAGHPALFWGP
ncbi:MAG: hypothetical protein AAFP13_14180, partial [Pseudomonadota bacterium]